MKRSSIVVAVFFGSIVIGVSGGIGFRYLVERTSSDSGDIPAMASREETQTAPVASDASDGLCIDLLGLRSDLPTSKFTHESDAGITVVKRGGLESFLIYPLIPGLDLEKEYKVSEKPRFSAERMGISVYQFDEEKQTSYLVDAHLPFFVILAAGIPDDVQAGEDAKLFLNTMRPEQCPHISEGEPVSGEYIAVKQWIDSLSKTAQAGIEDAYNLEREKYENPPSTREQYFSYMQCGQYILEIALQGVNDDAIRTTANGDLRDMSSYLSLSHVVSTTYIEERLKADLGLRRMLDVDGIASGVIMMEDFSASQTACRNLPVPEKYKK